MKDDLGEGLISDALPEHGPAVEGDLLLLVSPAQGQHDIRGGADVLHSRRAGPDLSSQHIIKNLRSIFLALKKIYINISRLSRSIYIEYIFDISSSGDIQEIFGKDPGEIEYIFDFSSSREIRERFERDSGKIKERLNIYSIFLVQERFERDSREIRERSRRV